MQIPDALKDDWMIWRLVMRKVASLKEIDDHWSMLEVWKGNQWLDLQEAAEKEAYKQAQTQNRGSR